MAKHQFTADNQPKNRRGRDKRQLLIDALKRKGYDEETLYDTIVDPLPKPVSPVFEVDFPEDGTPVQKIDAVIRGIASGIIPADIGKMFAEVIKTGLDIAEVTELAVRLERLEKLLGEKNA
jgi:hypothetical protein